MKKIEKLIVFDTTLRDGEQSPGCRMNVATKLLVAEQLARLGVNVIEAGFAISSPGDFEAISKISQAIREPSICSLARTRREDIEAAAKSLEKAGQPRIHVFVGTSDVHMNKKLRKSPAEIIDMVTTNVRLARTYVEDVQFSPEDAARTGINFLEQVVSAAVDAGANTINIPDTVGYSVCCEYPQIISRIKALLFQKNSKAIISAHCHNDLGLAVANTLAGVQAGVRQVECCVLGIGERAGNAQLEAVVMALKTRKDKFNIRLTIDTKRLYETARIVASSIGKIVSDTLPIVGGNAFSHGAGVHQHGMSRSRLTYEIMRPEDVGWQGEATPLTKHSGRVALESRLIALGYKIKSKAIDNLWPKFKSLADQKTYVYNDDLHLLMQEYFVDQMTEKERLFKVDRIDYHRVGNTLSATVILSQNGKTLEVSGAGDGPVASIGDAIQKASKMMGYIGGIIWEGYIVSQSTGGLESMGSVNIRARSRYGGGVGYGRASDTDVIVASAKAMVSAINHLIQTPVKKNRNSD